MNGYSFEGSSIVVFKRERLEKYFILFGLAMMLFWSFLEVLIWQPGVEEHISDFLKILPLDNYGFYEQRKGEKAQRRNPFVFHDTKLMLQVL